MWVRLYNTPPSVCQEEETFKAIGNQIGIYLGWEKPHPDASNYPFVRICVLVDLRKAIVPGVPIDVPMYGIQEFVVAQYEDLPLFCFNCSKIGHCVRNRSQCCQKTSLLHISQLMERPKHTLFKSLLEPSIEVIEGEGRCWLLILTSIKFSELMRLE